MNGHKVVSRDEWIAARRLLLVREKEFTRARDHISAARRALPWVRVDKAYVFDGAKGEESFADLFEGKSQLLVFHFMFDSGWESGCKSCSFWADNFNGVDIHLKHRDVTFTAISKAPYPTLDAYRKRMGWNFKWVSSFRNDFNRDYHVSFTQEERDGGKAFYNYEMRSFPASEAPGISTFIQDGAGNIFHTYSCYARGLDMLNGAYHLLDLMPKGRDEEKGRAMAWLRHRDRYED